MNTALASRGRRATTATTGITAGARTSAQRGRRTATVSPESSKTQCWISAWLHP
nr:MAG TPA: hypothetical protein [Caudoviricetes sp.]